MKKIFGCIIAIGFLCLFGTVGAMDTETISFGTLIMQSAGSLLLVLTGVTGFNLSGRRRRPSRRTNVRAISYKHHKHCA